MDLAPARHPQPAPDRIVNGLSVDVEDWFQVGAFENTIARGDWDAFCAMLCTAGCSWFQRYRDL